jgi:ribonuclease HI
LCFTGWSWCVRDSNGAFVAPGTNNCRHILTVVEGEAMTILEAMREAISKGWSNIMFESDSKVVVEANKANPQGTSELWSIISLIKDLLQCDSNFEVKFIRRQTNRAVHSLARTVIYWSIRSYFNSISHCIEPFIINEMS